MKITLVMLKKMPNRDRADKPTEVTINPQMSKTEVVCKSIREGLRDNKDPVQVKTQFKY